MCENNADIPRRIRILLEELEAEKEKVESLKKERKKLEEECSRLRFIVSEYIPKEDPELTNRRLEALYELQKRMKQIHAARYSSDTKLDTYSLVCKGMEALKRYLYLTKLGRIAVKDFYKNVDLDGGDNEDEDSWK